MMQKKICTQSGQTVYSLGIGSRHLGGTFEQSSSGVIKKNGGDNDDHEIAGVRANLDAGSNYIDVCHHYGYGSSVEIIGNAIVGYQRENLWLNAKLEDHLQSVDDVIDSLDRYCAALGTDYIDSYQIHAPMHHIDHQTVVQTIHQLIKGGKVRYLSISNFNIEQLQEIKNMQFDQIVTHEINYNLITRVNEENGVIDRNHNNRTQTIVYQPLKRNVISQSHYPIIETMAQKYNLSVNQLLLNRICIHHGFIALNKSTDPEHITQNHKALSFVVSESDYQILDQFRPDGYFTPDYDYWGNDDSKPKIWKL